MMNITGPTDTSVQQLTLTAPKAFIAQWGVGQIIQAIAMNKPQSGVVNLRIGATVVEAHTTLPLEPQQAITLEVVKTGKQPLLKVMQEARLPDIVAQTLRTNLPRQAPLGPVLQSVGAWLRTASPENNPHPAIMQAIQQLIAHLPQTSTVAKGDGLRLALSNSGLWLEAKLARPTAAPSMLGTQTTQDLKADLLRLLSTLTAPNAATRDSGVTPPSAQISSAERIPTAPAPRPQETSPNAISPPSPAPDGGVTKLTTLVEAALARIQVNQLHTLASEGQPNPVWLAELPVRRDDQMDMFELHIQREGKESRRGPDTAQRRWSVWLKFDLDTLGPLSARISLMGEEVSAGLWAERRETVTLIRSHLEALQGQLVEAGLKVQQLTCMPGPAPNRPGSSTIPQGLVDISA